MRPRQLRDRAAEAAEPGFASSGGRAAEPITSPSFRRGRRPEVCSVRVAAGEVSTAASTSGPRSTMRSLVTDRASGSTPVPQARHDEIGRPGWGDCLPPRSGRPARVENGRRRVRDFGAARRAARPHDVPGARPRTGSRSRPRRGRAGAAPARRRDADASIELQVDDRRRSSPTAASRCTSVHPARSSALQFVEAMLAGRLEIEVHRGLALAHDPELHRRSPAAVPRHPQAGTDACHHGPIASGRLRRVLAPGPPHGRYGAVGPASGIGSMPSLVWSHDRMRTGSTTDCDALVAA